MALGQWMEQDTHTHRHLGEMQEGWKLSGELRHIPGSTTGVVFSYLRQGRHHTPVAESLPLAQKAGTARFLSTSKGRPSCPLPLDFQALLGLPGTQAGWAANSHCANS